MYLCHGYLPSALIKITIVSIDKNIYRPIAIATISPKMLESVLLLKYSEYLTTCDNQLGFKANHGTDMCIKYIKIINLILQM